MIYNIGIDVGGTGIQMGIVNEQGTILTRGSITTRLDIPFAEQVKQMAECALDMIRRSEIPVEDIHSVGVGVPGIADQKTGRIIRCTNMNWLDLPFRDEFQKHLKKPVLIDNDANVAALAENVAGVSAGCSSSVFMTLGTGIGSGIVLNGRVWSGAHGIGGELGHTILELDGVPCSCGNHGCLERYCSATAIIRMAREQVLVHPESLILTMAGDAENINAKTVFDAAKEGDPTAEKIFRKYVRYLSMAIANVTNFLDPEMIVLGGGVSKAGNYLLDAVRAETKEYVLFNMQPMPQIEIARLGAEAGIIGAAMLDR